LNKLCDIKECPYCRADYKFVGGAEPLQQVGKYKCCLTKKDNKDLVPKGCSNKNYMSEMLKKYGRS
jgi:hypothetical protein